MAFTSPAKDIINNSLVSFSEEMYRISSKEDLLFYLYRSLPKNFYTGEIILFYKSEQFGLRRSYLKRKQVYEEKTENPWPVFREINYGSHKESLYLATEMGRPFSKVLVIPFPEPSLCAHPPVLFVEILKFQKMEQIKNFFEEKLEILDLILKRILLNTTVTHTSLLWSHVFGGLGEPIAILKQDKILRANRSFKELLFQCPHLKFHTDLSSLLHTQNHIYQIHSYPLSLGSTKKEGVRIFYAQDLTKYYYLKERLLQTKKMAQLEELGENIAHQLNNPLTGIRSMAQILIQDSKLCYLVEDFKEIEVAVARSQKIISSLLAFSKFQNTQSTCCDLNKVVQDTLPLLKTVTREIRITFNNNNREPCFVQGDLSLLKQILFNLIINSCQAFEDMKDNGSPYIEVRVFLTKSLKACLEVEDNGPGIPQENLEKIFQPLFTTKKEGKGTGLGLGIAQRFAESFGGKIYVKSSSKKGACFSLILPLSNNSYA